MPDKYHGGIPTDHLPPVRQRFQKPEVEKHGGRSRALAFLHQKLLIVWFVVYRMLHLRPLREARARRAILRSIEIRGARRVSTIGLILDGIRGGPSGPARYDHLETLNLMAMAKACGATMMANSTTAVRGFTSIPNPTGAFQETVTTEPTQDQTTHALLGSGNAVVGVAVPTGVAATDAAAIQAADLQVVALGGGMVQLQAGTYACKSTSRTDAGSSYTGSGSNHTWTDTSITAADVGSYVIGTGVQATPMIVSVVAGTSFITDTAIGGTISAASIIVVKAGFTLSPGVTISGLGSTYSPNVGYGPGTPSTTKILDSGSGVTCFVRGTVGSSSSTWTQKFGLQKLSIWGNANSTLYGLYTGNFAWLLTMDSCDVSFHGTASLALDGNVNSFTFKDSMFAGSGTVGATSYSGGLLMHPFWAQPSAGCNFWNCFFDANYGWGVTDAGGQGAYGVGFYGCQWNNTSSSAATSSGTSAQLQSHGNADGVATIIGGWSESAQGAYDLDLYGSPSVYAFSVSSSTVTAHVKITGGCAFFGGCAFENTSGPSITFGSGGNISWAGCFANDSYFYSGCGFTNGTMPNLGASGSSAFQSTTTASGATPSIPTFANGTAAQLAQTTKDAMVYLTVGTAGTAMVIQIGPTSTPANTVVSSSVATPGELYAIRLPAGWYLKWSATTATIANQLAVTC